MATILRRFRLALIVAVLGLVVLLAGVASATVFRPADIESAQLPETTKSQVVITRQGVLALYPSDLTITVAGPADTVLAVGRSTDVAAWAEGMEHTRIDGVDAHNRFLTQAVKGSGDVAVMSPAGSDMWVTSQVITDKQTSLRWAHREGQWSVIAYSPSGTPKVTFSWKTGYTTPWLWPLVIAGAVLLLAGGLLALLAWRNTPSERESLAEPANDTVSEVPADDDHSEPVEADAHDYVGAYVPADADGTWGTGNDAGDDYADAQYAEWTERDRQALAGYSEDAWDPEVTMEGGEDTCDALAYAGQDGAVDAYDDALGYAGQDDQGGAYDDADLAEGSYEQPDAYEVDPYGYAPAYGDEGDHDGYSDESYVGAYGDTADEAQADPYSAQTGYDEPTYNEGDDHHDALDQGEAGTGAWDPTWEQDMARPQTLPAPPGPPTHLPTRRQMREARKRGEATIEIEGVKYPTGLIPVVREQILAMSDTDEGPSAADFSGDSAFDERGGQ